MGMRCKRGGQANGMDASTMQNPVDKELQRKSLTHTQRSGTSTRREVEHRHAEKWNIDTQRSGTSTRRE
eukprot:3666408-Pleurochrysis_carterae.AAC.1